MYILARDCYFRGLTEIENAVTLKFSLLENVTKYLSLRFTSLVNVTPPSTDLLK